jgi:mannonate dehydratase
MELGVGAIHWAGTSPQTEDDRLTFARQLGITQIIFHTPDLRGNGYWEFQDLVLLRTRVESFGCKLFGVENMPRNFYDKVRLGLPGRDEQLELVCKTITNMGRAGIHCLGYDFNLVGVWRTGRDATPTSRAGAAVTSYNHEYVKNAPLADVGPMDDDKMWANFEYFLKAVVPVAEKEGVVLALHPDDPPMPSIAGTARIFRSTAALKRVVEIVDSPSNCLEFCQGTVAEWCQTAEEVYEAIRYFASRQKISYVHFRNVAGVVPDFEETFIDNGKVDMLEAMRCYKESNFQGVLMDDHTPHVIGDSPWGHRGRAFSIGFMVACMRAVGAC